MERHAAERRPDRSRHDRVHSDPTRQGATASRTRPGDPHRRSEPKGAPGLAFETWILLVEANQSLVVTPGKQRTLPVVAPSETEGSAIL